MVLNEKELSKVAGLAVIYLRIPVYWYTGTYNTSTVYWMVYARRSKDAAHFMAFDVAFSF